MIRIPKVKPEVKKEKTEKKKEEAQFCINCKHSSFDYKFLNLDIYGRPTLLICPFLKHKQILRDTCCTGHYTPKENTNE